VNASGSASFVGRRGTSEHRFPWRILAHRALRGAGARPQRVVATVRQQCIRLEPASSDERARTSPRGPTAGGQPCEPWRTPCSARRAGRRSERCFREGVDTSAMVPGRRKRLPLSGRPESDIVELVTHVTGLVPASASRSIPGPRRLLRPESRPPSRQCTSAGTAPSAPALRPVLSTTLVAPEVDPCHQLALSFRTVAPQPFRGRPSRGAAFDVARAFRALRLPTAAI